MLGKKLKFLTVTEENITLYPLFTLHMSVARYGFNKVLFVLHALQTPTRSVSEVMQLDSRDYVICRSDIVVLLFFMCFLDFWVSAMVKLAKLLCFVRFNSLLLCLLLCPALLCCSLHTKLIHLNVQLCVMRMKDL